LTRPVVPPSTLVRAAVASARGSPFVLRQLANVVLESWRESKVLPSTHDLMEVGFARRGFIDWKRLTQEDRKVLTALAVLRRSGRLDELAIAADLRIFEAGKSLKRLASFQAISHRGRGASCTFRLDAPEVEEELARGAPPALAHGIHEKLAVH